MIHDEIVTYEVAKLAKKKGFRENCSSLSVGDWFQARMVKLDYDDLDITPPMRVAEISSDEVMLQLGSVKHYAFVEDLQPIPITPEILEKNGFARKDKYRFVNTDILSTVEKYGYKYYDYHNIYKKGKTYRPIRVGVDNIKYVHELQHAMRLVGIEKEIEI